MKMLDSFLLILYVFFIDAGEVPGPQKPNKLDQCIQENFRPIWGFDYNEKGQMCVVYDFYYKSKVMTTDKYIWDEQERSYKEEDKRKKLINLAKTWFKIYAKFHRLKVEGNAYVGNIQLLIHGRLITDTEKDFFNMSIEVLNKTLLLLYKKLPDQERNAINQQISQGHGNIFDHEPFKSLINFYKTQLQEISPTLDELNINQLVANLKYTIIEAFKKDKEISSLKQKPFRVPTVSPIETDTDKPEPKTQPTKEQLEITPPPPPQKQKVTTTSYSKWFWEMLTRPAAWFRYFTIK